MENRDQLEIEIQQLEAEANEYRRNGNEAEYILKMREANLKRTEVETQEIIYATAEEITSSMETFTVGDTTFSLEELSMDLDAANILRSGLQATSKSQAQKFLDEMNIQKTVYEIQLNNNKAMIDHLIEDRDGLQSANAQLQLEKDDVTEKRDAAAQQLLEAQQEIARLNSHVDDLRKEIAVGASNVHNVIDITSDAELEAAAQRLKAKKEQADLEKRAAKEAARVKVYNIQQLDGTGAMFGANRADNDEYITYGWLERANFIELSNEEAARFRTELEAAKESAKADMESVPEAVEPVEVEEPTFRGIEAPEIATVQEYTVHGEVDAVAVEDGSDGESFEQAVERRLRTLELTVYQHYAAITEEAA